MIKNIPVWSDYVEELRRDSLIWHRHWRECGQPHHGPVSELHRISRACYHKAVRSVIKIVTGVELRKWLKP